MTILTTVDIAASASAAGFLYVRDSTVALVSVTGKRDAPSTPLRTVLHSCAATFAPQLRAIVDKLSNGTLVMFSATHFWEQHGALSRRRGIWGGGELQWLTTDIRRSTSVEITRETDSRFAGLVEIETKSLFDAADFARTHESTFLYVSERRNLSDERVREIFAKVFPDGKSGVDWGCVVDQIRKEAAACIRVSGNFDDPEASIDVFLSAELFARLGLKSGDRGG
jgi:hypothetical protein